MNEEKEIRNSKNRFELEGNVARINEIYTNKNGKKTLRFDLGQNSKGNSQFVPVVIKGELVNTYGKEIKKGDWICVKGRITSYNKPIEKDGREFNNKVIEILGFEIEDRKNHKTFTSDGQVKDINKEEMER